MPDFQTIFLQFKSACNGFEKTFWIPVIMHSEHMNEYKNKEVMLKTLTTIYETFVNLSE